MSAIEHNYAKWCRTNKAIVPGPGGELDAVEVERLDKEQRAALVERILETKDQDVRRLLEKIRERKRRHAAIWALQPDR